MKAKKSPIKMVIHRSKAQKKTIKKEIQGSGKAPFPGEKQITDESPKMEDLESSFDS